jgi:hypothetical protein
MASDIEETRARVLHLTEYACKLFGAGPGEMHREHFMVAAETDDGNLVTSSCCPEGLVKIVVSIVTTRPDRTELICPGPAGEKGN